MIAAALKEWLQLRRRVREELAFHFDQLFEHYTSAGYTRSGARKAAKQRLGSLSQYRRKGRAELHARVEDLLSAINDLRPRTPWVAPFVSLLLGFLLDALLLWRMPRLLLAAGFWAPVVAVAFLGQTISVLRRKYHWRYHLYVVLTLISTALLSIAVWGCAFGLYWMVPWHRVLLAVIAFHLLVSFYFAFCCAVVRIWYESCNSRCPHCAVRLRLPKQEGIVGNMLIDTASHSSICARGHGVRTVNRWEIQWRANGDIWHELSSAASR